MTKIFGFWALNFIWHFDFVIWHLKSIFPEATQ